MPERGRPKTFDSDRALEAAMNLFWERGYEGSSLAELLAVMELSRSSLYQSFGAKDEVFRLCLARYADALLGNLREGLASAPTGRVFLEQLLTSVASTAGNPEGDRSCLIVNSVTEFGSVQTIPGTVLSQGLEAVSSVLVEAVVRAQAEGDLDPAESPADLAAFFHVALSGLRTMIKAGASPESIQNTLKRLLKAF
ncbi:MAG: TetR/AcrR family transcriptional regulator [Spirochaetales bacterium]